MQGREGDGYREGRRASVGRSLEPHDAGQLRISDEDRHQVSELLRTAAGDGRIDLDELDERLEATYAAKTYADLVPITVDLPAHASGHSVAPMARPVARPVTPSVPGTAHGSSFALMSECKRLGNWRVGDRHNAVAIMGSVTLDLREAYFESREVTISACAIMGEINVVVNAATVVVVDGFGVMGEFNEQREKIPHEPTQGAPVVHVRGIALMGAVHVQRKPMPGETRRRLRGRA
jgi:Domain of unknown function (DUF1707)